MGLTLIVRVAFSVACGLWVCLVCYVGFVFDLFLDWVLVILICSGV